MGSETRIGVARGPAAAGRQRRGAVAAFALCACLAALPAGADTVAAVNRGRTMACRHGDGVVLRESGALDGVARSLARGASLHEALATLPLHPEFAAAIELGGVGADERSVADAIARRGCGDLGHVGLREVGVYRAGATLYLVVAVPLPVPAPAEHARVEREVLARVNAARAAPRRCGATSYPAVEPVLLSDALSRIAAGHSATMGARDALAHQDPDGSTPADRVRHGGYAARIVGENIASGVPTAAGVVDGWLASPGHCANIMDGRFREMGVAYSIAPRTGGAIYWTQVFATRRS